MDRATFAREKESLVIIKYKASERKVDLYDIEDGLTLMNVILKNQDGKMTAIDIYIGAERNGFSVWAIQKAWTSRE